MMSITGVPGLFTRVLRQPGAARFSERGATGRAGTPTAISQRSLQTLRKYMQAEYDKYLPLAIKMGIRK